MQGLHATPEGTSAFAARQAGLDPSFYRRMHGLTFSTLGIGTYLGELDAATDEGYVEAIGAALMGGINLIDTSLNYRHQNSERNVGTALKKAFALGIRREEVILCTKAGYLVPGAVPTDVDPSHIVGGMHCLEPSFLRDQMERSLANLGVTCIDVYYLHNPETQVRFVDHDEFHARVRRSFEELETCADAGRIRFYGIATWDGLRKPGQLNLVQLEGLARDVAGDKHRFRFVQLPFNFAMTEALTSDHEEFRGQSASPLTVASGLGLAVIASAPLLQARLARGLPAQLAPQFPGINRDPQRAIQFARSTPGILSALVGMSRRAHVEENLELARLPVLEEARYDALWRQDT
jgi:aryl-alcohol dehydrogenase-like predicted oxidoreductase